MKGSESYPMAGGDGPYSYAKNSNQQKRAADVAKAKLVAAVVENLDIEQYYSSPPTSKIFRIADLGCSTGPNTFTAVNNIIEAIEHKFHDNGHTSCLPQFQVFFSDHVSNDFNTLFNNLPSDRQYFAAGVPGSFHGRLFPEASLDFVYSSFALHWLSKAPGELAGDLNSPLCNKGRIHYFNAPNQVGEAYAAQYAKDLESFLDARARELTPGGLMAILHCGRPDGTLPIECSFGLTSHFLESSLIDMANEGVVSEAEIDSFNLPSYFPSAEEQRMLIERNGCFRLVELEPLHQGGHPPATTGECRAIMEGLFSKHFRSEIIEQLFDRYTQKIAGYCPPLSASDATETILFALLKRNP